MKAILIMFAAVATMIVSVSWYVFHLDESLNKAQMVTIEQPKYADAEFRNALIRVSGENGDLLYLTRAASVTRFSDESVEITTPYVIANQEKGNPWHLSAESVTLMNNNKQAILHGNVHADREKSAETPEMHLSSRDVSIDTTTKFAHSDAFTKIESENHVTTGTGIDVWFDTPTRVRLLSNTRSIYTP